jgi:transcriptional regulator with XRE-family HTH domain
MAKQRRQLVNRPGQQPRALTPYVSARHFLGTELRRWRELRELSAAELARRVFVSSALVQKVEKAQRTASADLIRSCDEALNTGGALSRLLAFVTHVEHTPEAPVAPEALQERESIVITISAHVVPPDTVERRTVRPATGDGARIYAFPGGRHQTGAKRGPR